MNLGEESARQVWEGVEMRQEKEQSRICDELVRQNCNLDQASGKSKGLREVLGVLTHQHQLVKQGMTSPFEQMSISGALVTAHPCPSINGFVFVTADTVIARYELQSQPKHSESELLKQEVSTNQKFCSEASASSWEKKAPEELKALFQKGCVPRQQQGWAL